MEEKSPWGAARGAGASGTRNGRKVLYVLGNQVQYFKEHFVEI